MKSKPVVIYFMKGKLSPIDTHLPLMMELLSLGLVEEVSIFCSDTSFNKLLQEQWLLKRALNEYSIRLFVKPEGRSTSVQVAFLLKCLWNLKQILYRRVWLFGLKDTPGHFRTIFDSFRKFLGAVSFGTLLDPRNDETYEWLTKATTKEFGRVQNPIDLSDVDVMITSRNALNPNWVLSTKARRFNIGYVRGLQSWTAFVGKYAAEDLGEISSGAFFFWPLAILKREEKNRITYNFEDQLLETLEILNEIGYPLTAVFRFHPTTDRDAFFSLLKRAKFSNFKVSNAHPSSLIARANFVFSNTGSTIFCDAHYSGCPVVQYSSLRHFYAVNDDAGWPIASIYKPMVNFFVSNKQELIKVLLLLNDGSVSRTASGESSTPFTADVDTIRREFVGYSH